MTTRCLPAQNAEIDAGLPKRAIISRPDARDWVEAIPGESIAIRVRSRDVGGKYSIVDQIIAPMSGPPLHTHREDEIFEVLEGTMTFVCNGERFEAEAGTMIVIPAGAAHAWANLSGHVARMRGIFVPGGFEGIFQHLASVPRDQLDRLVTSFGSAIVGPPLVA